MTDHKPYILNTLSRAIEAQSESRAKTTSPKVWKALKEAAPQWPIYDSNTLSSDLLTAWDVAKRVAIDDIIKSLLGLTAIDGKVLAKVVNDANASADKTELKSVADA